MLFVEHVTKKYGKLTASDDITFRVENGQIAVLLGPNGAGNPQSSSALPDCCAFRERLR